MTGNNEMRAEGLSEWEIGVWRSFLLAHARVSRKLEADLVAEHALQWPWYDVMVHLVSAQDHRLRMSELAERVLITRSGLTRLVDRLVSDGLVRREVCQDDARGYFAILTLDGYHRLCAASQTYQRGLQDYAVGRFSEQELSLFGELLTRLAQEDPCLSSIQ